MRWMGHILRRKIDEPVKRAWDLDVDGIRGKGRTEITWKGIVKKESSKVGLKEGEDAQNRKKWKEGVSSWCKSR